MYLSTWSIHRLYSLSDDIFLFLRTVLVFGAAAGGWQAAAAAAAVSLSSTRAAHPPPSCLEPSCHLARASSGCCAAFFALRGGDNDECRTSFLNV